MLIACPSCATSYNVDAANLHPDGRQVRCVRCRTVWHAKPQPAGAPGAAADMSGGQSARMAAATAEAGSAPNLVQGLGATDQIEWQDNPDGSAAGDGSGPDRAATQPDIASAPPPSVSEVAAPPLVPEEPDAAGTPVQIEGSRADGAAALPEDIETYAARRAREERLKMLRWPLSLVQSIALLLLIIDAVLIGWRDDMVRLLPQTASFYGALGLAVNTRGLSFTDVGTTAEKHEGVPILVVEGSIVNDTRKFIDVPRLKFEVRNGADEDVYSWTAVPPRPTLAPHESVAFRSRLASPPPEGRTVLVRFITRHDLAAGGR
jgi:predicted Zn finger-like uncharacterized protein